MQVLLALSSQWGDPGRREEMVQSGRQVINIIHTKMGAGSLSAASSLPGPGVFRKLHVKLSNSYDKGQKGNRSYEGIFWGFLIYFLQFLRLKLVIYN